MLFGFIGCVVIEKQRKYDTFLIKYLCILAKCINFAPKRLQIVRI